MQSTAPNQNNFRFGPFEANVSQGELRKQGVRLRLQEQPFQVLTILLEDAGKLVAREELRQRLWPADTFVDFDHSLNTAINKIREVLGDSASTPLFVETVPKRGYRFIAAVQVQEAIGSPGDQASQQVQLQKNYPKENVAVPVSPQELNQLPGAPRRITRTLFALIQVMYLLFYVAALAHLERIQEIAERHLAAGAHAGMMAIMVSAMVAIPVRLYLLSSVSFDYRGLGIKFQRLFPALLLLDEFWALTPFLMAPRIGMGLAFAATAGLLYLPFSQKTLIRMAYPTAVPAKARIQTAADELQYRVP